MKIGLIDFDSKIPNVALMRLSAMHKAAGDTVTLNPEPGTVDHAYCSVLFTWNREKAAELRRDHPSIEFGGIGWDPKSTIPAEARGMTPDYDLYTVADLYPKMRGIKRGEKRIKKAQELIDAGIGHTSRGCVRSCAFCMVPGAEGSLYRDQEIRDLINPRSKKLVLLDNNLTADPDCLEKLAEIRNRELTVNISQGIDIRTLTPEVARALASVKLWDGRIHYAWDLIGHERMVRDGIRLLLDHLKSWRHICYMLVGFNTDFEEDMHRFKILKEMGVTPYAMLYNKDAPGEKDLRLRHFARWVNARIHKACPDFEQYTRWARDRDDYFAGQAA